MSITFATIVGLLADFKSEGRDRTDDEYKAFTDMLSHKRHKSLLKELGENHQLASSVKLLLQGNHNELIQKLEGMDSILRGLALNIPVFSDLVSSLPPGSQLSEQSISILREFRDSGADTIVMLETSGGIGLIVSGGKGGSINISDERFLRDDLHVLSECGFLMAAGKNSQGSSLWRITRIGVSFIDQIDKDSSQ